MPSDVRLFLSTLAAACCLAGAAFAAAAPTGSDDLVVSPDRQSSLAVTIYRQKTALIEDRRMVTLTEGLNRVAFEGVSAELEPDTVMVDGLDGTRLHLLEQRFENNLLTQRALIEASIGKEVRIAIRNYQTGTETIEKATLLAANPGVLVRIGDRIEMPPGQIVFDSVPPGLRARPALVLAFTTLKGGTLPIEAGYLTGGLSWSANYVAEIDPSEQKLALNGRASIANKSGAAYDNAQLTLVAGTLNRIERPEPRPAMPMMAMAREAAPAPPMKELSQPEPVGDYYRYTLDRKISLGDRETVQLALLQAPAVPVSKQYRFVDSPAVTSQAGNGEPVPIPVEIRYSFRNTTAAGLGMALPAGIVRVYQRTADGAIAFIGEDRLADTPAGKEARLTTGHAFDVTAERRQTGFSHPSDKSYETSQQIKLKNARAEAVTIEMTEEFAGDWRILESSDAHEKTSGSTEMWHLKVPAHGEHTVTYRVATHF